MNTEVEQKLGKRYKLFERLIAISKAYIWDDAQLEWQLDYITRGPTSCLCGKEGIMEVCHIINKLNGNRAILGNCCITKIGLRIPKSLFRVAKDNRKPLEYSLVKEAYERGELTDWEFRFYSDTLFVRKLFHKRLAKRIEINKKILAVYLVG